MCTQLRRISEERKLVVFSFRDRDDRAGITPTVRHNVVDGKTFEKKNIALYRARGSQLHGVACRKLVVCRRQKCGTYAQRQGFNTS